MTKRWWIWCRPRATWPVAANDAVRAAWRTLAVVLALGVLTAAGCGDDDDAPPARTPTPASTATPTVPANQPPVLAPIGDQTIVLGGDRLVAVFATDPEGDPVSLSAEGLPDNAYFLPNSGIFCFYADVESHVGQPIQITFTASDGTSTDTETITVQVVRPDAAALAGLATQENLRLEPIGNHSVRAGETLTLQIAASGASPITCKMMPQPSLAPLVTFDAESGEFRFTPTAAQIGQSFEVTFQACVPKGNACDEIAQVHETIYLSVLAPPTDPCPDYLPPPATCTELAPGAMPGDLPQPLESCYVVRKAGIYTFEYVNILANGGLYFVPDPTGTIDFRVKSLLVEKGGVLQAGSPTCPFGGPSGGFLSIGLYGDDPSMEGKMDPAPVGIRCMTDPMGSHSGCFPEGRDPEQGTFYCTVRDSDDPCSSTTPPKQDADNYLLEHYGNLNFDSTPWGYKTLGVSYGGSLRLFGWKGVRTTPDDPDHCDAPTPEQSTLDAAEMQAWADLTYSSWARLADISQDRTLLTLDRQVSTWQKDDEIVVGTTDWYPSHSERRTITAVNHVQTPAGMRTQLTVAALDYPHNAEIFDAEKLKTVNHAEYTGPVSRTAADLRATVGLLTRSIEVRSLGITATDDFPDVASCLYKPGLLAQTCSNTATGCPCGASSTTDPGCYFGGHLIFRQGFKDVQIQGVELRQLGQGGRMGHYPVHFHLAKSTEYTQGKAFLKDSSVWDSMTRFVTLHGTHNVSLLRNVGYLSVGHGYYLEDGSEIDNLLCHNLGVEARASLKEYFEAQAAAAGSDPPLTARYVPPILDGVSPSPALDPKGPTLRNGSDSYMPVMFWAMNAYNEFVGNAAAGVHGFGSCYWLLGSGVSGPSVTHKFSGLAKYNLAGAYQAPLLRFRGNSCTTATYALPASAELSPAAICEAVNTGYTPIQNPYVYNTDGTLKPNSFLMGKYDRPAVSGNFQPIEPNTETTGCAAVGTTNAGLQPNTVSCVTTVLDRFTTSFNWAQVNYGSIWLRPWFYLLLNPAVTDQLFGGVTFVTAGSWVQVPPAYFSLAKNGLYVGVSQFGGSEYARRSGPKFSIAASDDLTKYAPCNVLGNTTCNLVEEGIGLWTGGFQPKRLINIYDGPHFADDNLFLNVGAWQCDPQPCLGKGAGQCVMDLPCGIYTSTFQPAPPVPMGQGPDPHKMIVVDAGIGWKQPNGFYYPPAFTYRDAHFFKTLPTGLPPPPEGEDPLNRCYGYGPDNNFAAPQFRDGDCRHNTVDRTSDYIAGSMLALNGGPATYPASLNLLPTTPIDFSTIIIDLNASLTGASGMISGVETTVPTTSISRNAFFDAPAQSDECLSFGVQTTPYQAVTTNIAPLKASPANGDTYVEPWSYTFHDPVNNKDVTAASTPLVAIYRQWKTAKDPATCGQVCSTEPSKLDQYGCTRGTFMAGPNIGHATYLTVAQPPGLAGQPGASYYIDTSTASQQPTQCIRAKTDAMRPGTFDENGSYVVYNLFARNDTVISYQLYVGDSVPDGDLAAIKGRFVRVTPHLTSTDDTNGFSSFRSQVVDACDPNSAGAWCSSMPKPTVKGGILTVTLDQRPIAADFQAAKREDYDRCMPRDVCYFDGTQCQPCLNNPSKCIRQDDFLPSDLASMNQTDGTGTKPLEVVCQDWATYASGTTSDTLGDISLVDCPAGGCLGFAFTLPSGFMGNKTYEDKGAALAECFQECAWMDDALVERTVGMTTTPADPLCGAPRAQAPADYCAAGSCPMPTPGG